MERRDAQGRQSPQGKPFQTADFFSSLLNQIAKAAHMGALPVTPELEEDLQEACQAVRSMRSDLMRALGFPDGEEEP
jgi:hypothetical protein